MKRASVVLLVLAFASGCVGLSVVHLAWPPVGFEASGLVYAVSLLLAAALGVASAVCFAVGALREVSKSREGHAP